MPKFGRKVLHYLDDMQRWEAAGKPVVSDEVYAERAAQCKVCPHRQRSGVLTRFLIGAQDECSLCGCPTNKTLLGDMLRMATKECPDRPGCNVKDCPCKPRWLATVKPPELPEPAGEIPPERRVMTWIDDMGDPIFLDIAELTPEDAIIKDAWVVDQPPVPECKESCVGLSREIFQIKDIARSGFAGTFPILTMFAMHKTEERLPRVELERGLLRFADGKPVEIIKET